MLCTYVIMNTVLVCLSMGTKVPTNVAIHILIFALCIHLTTEEVVKNFHLFPNFLILLLHICGCC